MEGTKPRTASSLGMFDLLKGVGMLLIVFAHTSELYPVGDISTITPVTFFLFAYRESLMAAFYIASGYGFRKRSIGKCISQQFKTLFKPYAYTGLATTIAHFIIHYKTFGNWNNAVYETYKVLGGFVLGLPHTATYFGQEFFSCGPMWYLLALMIGWILLDIILNIFPESYIKWAVLGTMLLGWGISLVWEAPFCIAQGMVTVPYLYIGFLAKKKRLFEKKFRPLAILGLLAAALGVALTPQKSHQPHRRARCWKMLWAHWPQSLRRGRWVAAIRSNPPHPVLSGQAPRRCRGQCGHCWPDHAGRPDFSAAPRGRSARPRRRRPLPPAGRRPAPAQSPCPARIFGSVPSFVTPIHVCVRFVLVVVCDGWRTFIHKNIRHRGAMTDIFVCV